MSDLIDGLDRLSITLSEMAMPTEAKLILRARNHIAGPQDTSELEARLRDYAENGSRPWIGIQSVFLEAAQSLSTLRQRIEALAAENARLREEIEERDEWLQIVDTIPLDQFDGLGDKWIARMPIVRMINAIASVFSKWANEDIMVRFRKSMTDIARQSFVEGCICGVRNERARQALGEGKP